MKALHRLKEPWKNLMLHRVRSVLAALGIIFGVASVICMLSISEIARRDVINRIERMGIRNVILDSVKPEEVRDRERGQRASWVANYGITREDLEIMEETLPGIEKIVPMRILLESAYTNLQRVDIAIVGTGHHYDEVMQHRVVEGRFLTPTDQHAQTAVCVLGSEAARKLFPLSSPLEKVIKIGTQHFRVVGVMERKGQTGDSGILSNPDNAAYLPFETTFARFGKLQIRRSTGSSEATMVEVNRAVLQVSDSSLLSSISQAARNLMLNRHKQNDVSVTIPFSLLQERRQAENVFQWVMGSLAAISLLVGGIGIMNIMLANMAERRNEIGLRRALGARCADVIKLFLTESILLCAIAGVVGVAFGIGLAYGVGSLAGWTVVLHPLAIPLGIVISMITGLLFGTLPSMKAAKIDPVLALRAE